MEGCAGFLAQADSLIYKFKMDLAASRLSVIDLFSGAGGLSLGAARAGFRLAGAVELDKNALSTHRKNFPSTLHLETDVSTLSGPQLLESFGIAEGELSGLIGGPPCQGFSSIGKKNPNDIRNNLFSDFMRLVKETQPLFFAAENVPGILLDKNKALVDQALDFVVSDYVLIPVYKAEAAKLGAPTSRKRLFFIGFKKSWADKIDLKFLDNLTNFPVTKVSDALAGLPKRIFSKWQTDAQGWRKVEDLSDSYFNIRVKGHIPEGVGDPFAVKLYSESRSTSGNLGTVHSPEIAARYKALKPGEKDPISKSVRLDLSGFCPTLRAGTGPEKGSYQAVRPIHPTIGRVITPREAARLQGFPDWFVLPPSKWHSFRQIGNSVSPLVAEAVLTAIYQQIEKVRSQPAKT